MELMFEKDFSGRENVMQISKKRLSVFVVSVAAVAILSMGCATKGFVKKQVAAVDTKVNQVSTTVAENAEKLDATDSRARQGLAEAGAARGAANAAQASADKAHEAAMVGQSAANAAQGTADTANQGQQTAHSRVTTLEQSIDRYTAGPTTTVWFKAGKSELSKDAMRQLDDLVSPISGQDAGYRVEIQGFASSEGPEMRNVSLSQERSESVERYLISKGADVIRIKIVGLGIENPVGDNKTLSGRQQNRRAEIRVFSATK
jgi:outer membrane protein OmpA-like peptidoglycan-associated protein